MSDQADLIAKLSEATAGSRELSAEVVCAANGWTLREWFSARDFIYIRSNGNPVYSGADDTAPVTTSVDAALALIEKRLPGWYWGAGPGTATLLDEKMPGMFRVDARGATAQLALCIALLRSLQAQQTAALKPEGGET